MLDQPVAPMAGARRHDLPRAAGHRALSPPLDSAHDDLAVAIDRHLANARRLQQPLALLSIGLRQCQGADGQPQPQWLEAVALELGQRLRARVRRTDCVLWAGGREYAVVLHDCRQPLALAVQKRLLAGVQGSYRLGPMQVGADVAIGCACHPAAGDTGAQLLAAAQQVRGSLASG
jgi:GGDEF domain-containing protein